MIKHAWLLRASSWGLAMGSHLPWAAPTAPQQVSIPTWALVHLPVAVTLSTAWFTRKVQQGLWGLVGWCEPPSVLCL